MLESIHSWLIDHPIWQSFIINGIVGLVLLLLAAYWKFIAAFSRVPPQRLGTWLRKARLNANVTKLAALRRANEKPRIALKMLFDRLVPLFVYLGFEIAGFAMVVSRYLIPRSTNQATHHLGNFAHFMFETRAGLSLWIFVPLTLILIDSGRLTTFALEYAHFEATQSKLLLTINNLKTKLGEPLERVPSDEADSAVEEKQSGRTYRQGVRVKHPKYGEGTVFRTEGAGEAEKVTVQFERYGIKKLVSKFAQLERL
jgi:hypothetical protein